MQSAIYEAVRYKAQLSAMVVQLWCDCRHSRPIWFHSSSLLHFVWFFPTKACQRSAFSSRGNLNSSHILIIVKVIYFHFFHKKAAWSKLAVWSDNLLFSSFVYLWYSSWVWSCNSCLEVYFLTECFLIKLNVKLNEHFQPIESKFESMASEYSLCLYFLEHT